MKVAIIGGKLQGTEACLLAHFAGMETLLIDRDPGAPASGLADRFLCMELAAGDEESRKAFAGVDFILPANENDTLLAAIREIGEELGIPVCFDWEAYAVSSSKALSDALFAELGIPAPEHYPGGKAPYIVKPTGFSGSEGVRRMETAEEVEQFLASVSDPSEWIAEEYLEGRSYSIEVIGNGREYRTYQITEIHMDSVYDCCMVTAPCPELTEEQVRSFEDIGRRLGEHFHLRGIMDVEVIDDDGTLKVLEIDARLPSQTPLAIYFSTGVNFLAELASVTLTGEFPCTKPTAPRFSAYEHYRITEGELVQEGEHMMSTAGPLSLIEDFPWTKVLVADEMPGHGEFRGIFINSEETAEELERIRARLYGALERRLARNG